MSTTTRAMLLAAGLGTRMRPLTETLPKPLVPVGGRTMLDHALDRLEEAGIGEAVVNVHWLADQMVRHLDARRAQGRGPVVTISDETAALLDSGGGVAKALPLLGDVFWVLAGDVFTPGFQFSQAAVERFMASSMLAHLWLVPNPAHNLKGDFGLGAGGMALNLPNDSQEARYTFSTIALYRQAFFKALPFGNPDGIKAPLAPLLRAAMDNRQVSAELYTGAWTDVGTPQRLAELNRSDNL